MDDFEGQDETRPIPHTHRYGPEPADAPQGFAGDGPFGFQGSEPGAASTGQPRRRGTVTAGVLAGALLLGGVAGVGGAAGYAALTDDSSTSSTSADAGRVTTPVSPATSDGSSAPVESVQQVAASVLPSVVKINVSSGSQSGSGSGIILSKDGEILTNNHVVEVAGTNGSVTVSFNDGSTARARVLGTDPVTDIAVIKAEGVSGLTPATIGHSGSLAVGQGVVAVGSPFGLEATVTSGIVSALNRPVSVGTQQFSSSGPASSTTYPAIQTDAAINPGNSGGPLLNMQGEVVGVNSSIRTDGSSSVLGSEGGSIGLGFAIPMDEILPVIDQLRNGETATHARLGVTVSDVRSDNGLVNGAQIQNVEAGSAGANAGLTSGDVVTHVDDRLITGADSLVATIRGYRPGDQVTLTVMRNGTSRTVTATLGSDANSQSS